MDSRKSHSRQQQQSPPPQQHYGRVKGATKILSDASSEQEHLGKQRQPLDCTETNNANPCPINNIDTNMRTKNVTIQPVHNPKMHSINPSEANSIPSSSYNIQSCSTNDIADSLIIPAVATTSTTRIQMATTITQASNPLMRDHQQPQPQLTFRSPRILPYDIKSLFECPICFDYAVPPIYQCQNGHLVCQSCSSKITHCPTCRVPITEPSIRNLQLDRLANTFQFPCKYNFNGCQWKSYWFKKHEHEENCDYISYSCPCPGSTCKWTGLLPQVMSHLREHHKSITSLDGEDIVFLATDVNLKGAVDWVMIQSCFNQHFLLVLEKQELKSGQQQFFAVVQLIGSQREAHKFRYKLELTNCISGQTKRLQWEATPRSILDGIQMAISNYDCLVFDSRMAQHFLSPIKRDLKSDETNQESNHGENLGINVTIERAV